MILTAGGLLKVQKVSSPVWAQTASGSFNMFFTASVSSASVSWMSMCRWASFKLPVYSHIKLERRLKGRILGQRKEEDEVKRYGGEWKDPVALFIRAKREASGAKIEEPKFWIWGGAITSIVRGSLMTGDVTAVYKIMWRCWRRNFLKYWGLTWTSSNQSGA